MEELALHVLDLVQNCIEARATRVEIIVTEDTIANVVIVQIEDNGRGMSSEVLAAAQDPFFTTRTTRRVGLGIPLFKAAAEQAGGSFSIVSREGVGTIIKALFQRDNIDRPPLGSMTDTLAALLAVNPSLELKYTHQIDEEKFVLDTRELRDVCGDTLGHPKIIKWIKAYIAENEEKLGGEI